MIVLFMVVSFVIGYVSHFFQDVSFLIGLVVVIDFWHLLSSQMIVELSVGYWASTGSSSDHIIISAVGCLRWRELNSWEFW